MAQSCHYAALVFVAGLLGDHPTEPVDDCDQPAAYKAIVSTDRDGFVIEVTTPVCPVHEAHVVHNSGYKRSIKLRQHAT